ncbi:unnamed protein product [Brassica napus]|uniref:(rape) hypothetical protein n=1 Tax=Brassica napus TaxID=3708 RepID=A0A816LCP0_BRANA|nr:unnamed protein product [Brassica napus]
MVYMMPSGKSKKPLKIGTDSDSLSESSGKDTIVAKEGEFSEVRGGSNAAVEEKKKFFFLVQTTRQVK